jgi:small subunit ribosomal protein S7
MGMKLLKKAAGKKKGINMDKALAQEIMDAMEEKGEAYKEKITIQKMAAANKAYAHLA